VGGWSAPRTSLFTFENDPIPIVQQAGWVPGPIWTSAENLTSTGIGSLDRPVRSELLYQLQYSGPLTVILYSLKFLVLPYYYLGKCVNLYLHI